MYSWSYSVTYMLLKCLYGKIVKMIIMMIQMVKNVVKG